MTDTISEAEENVRAFIKNPNYVDKLEKPYESYVFILRKSLGNESAT